MIHIIAIVFLVVAGVSKGSEIRYGYGNFSVESKIFGTSGKIEENINVYSLVETHKNIFGSRLFYSYNLAFLRSKKEQKILDLYNQAIDPLPGYKPYMKYRLEGLNADAEIGYDIFRGKWGYVGISGLLGISLPYIKNYNSENNSSTTLQYIPDSKTKIKTYKIGGSLKVSYYLHPQVQFFGNVSAAYQTGSVKNEKLGIDSSVNGNYIGIEGGVKLYLIKTKKKIWILTLNPRLYTTLGFRYDYWYLKDIKINNSAILVNKDSLKISSSYTFAGVGYSF